MFKHQRIERRVNLVDIMPTVLDLLAVKIPVGVQGQSVLPLLQGKEEEERTFYMESVYGSEEMSWAPLTGMIMGDYKYISAPEPELYNIKNDPGEQNNLFLKEFGTAKEYDNRLGELILTFSTPGSTEKAKRDLTEKDVRHLKSLGYISAFSNKSKKGVTIDPKQGIIIYNKLKTFAAEIKKGENLDEIEEELKKILNGKPELVSPQVYSHLHEIYKKRNDTASALKILVDGVKEFPGIYRFRNRLAAFLFDLKRYDEVIEHCRFVLHKNPLSACAYTLLGDVYIRRNNFGESMNNFREAVKLEPENIQVKMKYADLLMRCKKYGEAVEVYNSVVETEDMAKLHDFHFKVAMLNTRHGSMDTAERIFCRLVDMQPSGKYYFYYAIALSRNKKYPTAVKSMEAALNEYARDLTTAQQQQAENALSMWKRNYKP
jgi:tetratricopeptide (TPR) repeat protein